MDTFEMLKRLLSQNEFELLLPDQTGAKEKNTDKTDIRLVYQMNDTIESFLVFKEARMTGTYKEDYEGAIEASFYRDGDDYALVVRQEEEDCVVTILFKTLELETNLYNYGDIAHFWRKGYENLRQLEFRIAVLWDKYEYLGEAVCNEEERKLVQLAYFPPLNYTCYPAISKEYLVERENAWKPAGQALSVMEELLKETGDKQLLRLVRLYAMFPVKILARYIAMQLHRTKHRKVVQLLQQQVRQAAKYYPERKFSGKEEKKFREQRKRAQDCAREWEEKGYRVDIFREEPFTVSRDSVEGKYYVMIWKKGFRNQKVKIKEIL